MIQSGLELVVGWFVMKVVERPGQAIVEEKQKQNRVAVSYLYKPRNTSTKGDDDYEPDEKVVSGGGGDDEPDEDMEVVSDPGREVPKFEKIKNLQNRGKTVYHSLLLSFIKSRHQTDNLMLIGPHGNLASGFIGDAREIYYDANAYIQRMSHGMKYIDVVNAAARQNTYQNVLRLLVSLTNTDAFLLVAFIFTWILTVDDRFIDRTVTNVADKIKKDRIQLRYSTVGKTMAAEFEHFSVKYSTDESKRFYFQLSEENTKDLKEWFNEQMSPEMMMFMFDAYQSDMDKAFQQTRIHKEKHRRGAKELVSRIRQNCSDLYDTLNAIINNNDRLNAAIAVLRKNVDEDKDPFVLIYMKDNQSFPFYDRERQVDTVIRGANEKIKGRIAWRIIDVYRELSSRTELHFNRCLKRYVLSRPSNDAITMRDMDLLLYEATMPFYHSKHEALLSIQFRMAYDFLFILREQHRRFGNAKKYIETLNIALRKPTLSLTENERNLCPIDIPFTTLVVDAFQRIKPEKESDSPVPRLRVINQLRYLDLDGIDETMHRVLLKERYLYDYACDVLYVKFQSQLANGILSEFKQIHGLVGPSPLALSLDNMSIVCRNVAPFSIDRSVLETHFRLVSTMGVDKPINVGPLWTKYIESINNVLLSGEDKMIQSLIARVVEQDDIIVSEYERAKLIDILTFVVRRMYQKVSHLAETRITRRDINTEGGENLCTDSSIIEMIERHPDYFRLSVEGKSCRIPVFAKKTAVHGSLIKAIMPFLSRAKQITGDAIKWFYKLIEVPLLTLDVYPVGFHCDVHYRTMAITSSQSGVMTVGDLKSALNAGGNRYLLLYRKINESGTESSYPPLLSYEIINDVTDYDTRLLSFIQSALFVIEIDDTLPTVVRHAMPIIENEGVLERDRKTCIVLIETRSLTGVVYRATILVDRETTEEDIYREYNTTTDVCVQYMRFERDSNTSMVLLTIESLGYAPGRCIYEVSTFQKLSNFHSYYTTEQQPGVVKEMNERRKKEDAMVIISEKTTRKRTVSTSKKKGGTTTTSNSVVDPYRFTEEQITVIRILFKMAIEQKDEGRFIRNGSMKERHEMMVTIVTEYISNILNLTEIQLGVNPRLIDIAKTLRATPDSERDFFFYVSNDQIERELVPLKKRLLDIYITPCYSSREYIIFNLVNWKWDAYTQDKYGYNPPYPPFIQPAENLEAIYTEMINQGTIVEPPGLQKATTDFKILYDEIVRDNGWAK